MFQKHFVSRLCHVCILTWEGWNNLASGNNDGQNICISSHIQVVGKRFSRLFWYFNPLKPELNPICYLLALLGHHFLHVSRIRVKLLTLRLLMSYIYIYTGCPRRKGQNFGGVFLMLKYTDITQNTYIQSWTVMEIMAREVWNFDRCYLLITKYILKLAGICGFCNVNICT